MRFPIIILILRLFVLENAAAAPPSRFENFITRKGDKLYDGEKEFCFIGANMPGLVLPYDYAGWLPERMVLPNQWEQEDGFKTLAQMWLRVVRFWNLPIAKPGDPTTRKWAYVLGPGQFNEEAFVTIDRALALANQYGIRVMFELTCQHGFTGGVSDYAAHRNKKGCFYTDPKLQEKFQATIRYVVNRRNTILAPALNVTIQARQPTGLRDEWLPARA
jgi:hypothetical protein